MTRLSQLLMCASIALAAMMAINAAASSGRPMLWETTTHLVSYKVVDPNYPGKSSTAGPPQTRELCLLPYKPKVGKVPNTDVDCRYERVDDRGEKISRLRICTSEFGAQFKTRITGIETESYYDLRLVTDLRDRNGKLLTQVVMLEAGRKLGECPPGIEVHGFAD